MDLTPKTDCTKTYALEYFEAGRLDRTLELLDDCNNDTDLKNEFTTCQNTPNSSQK